MKRKSSRKAGRKGKVAAGRPTATGSFGWVPDLPDHRDHMFAAAPTIVASLPPSMDLRRSSPPVYNQGQLGSCTANAIGGAIQFDEMKENLPRVFTPSRLFIYYNERVLEGSVNTDSGAMIRDGIKSVANQGDCPEPMWPYVIANFRTRPPQRCFQNARKHEAVSYQRLARDLNQMKGCLAAGYPFVFGFTVYNSFISQGVARTGVVPMPIPGEGGPGPNGQPAGHAVMAVGYDDSQHRFIVRNSWGTTWGMNGYFTMPYAYLLQENLADDFWTIRVVN